MKKKLLSLLMALCMVVTLLPVSTLATEPTESAEHLDFAQFLKAVEDAGYNYDGHDVTVRWSPSSACTDSRGPDKHTCIVENKQPDGNNAQRLQKPNAQYQIFSGASNLSISNVNFVFEPADFTLCMNSTWGGTATADAIRNAEFQLLNTGDVTFTNCTFDKVIVSPFNSTTKSTFTGCDFSNIYDSYAIKDIHSADTEITGCTFDHCGGAIYLEGSTAKNTITITGNAFTDIDTYAANNKIGTRGLIQFSANGDYTNAMIAISGNSSTGEAAVLRQLNYTVNMSKVAQIIAQGNNDFAGELFTANSNGENDQLPAETAFPKGMTVYDGKEYYATMQAALTNIHQAEARTLWCKPGTNLGTMTHGHVCYDLTVYGNGAYISGGERDFELDTYNTGHSGEKYLSNDVNLAIYNLNGAAVWGQRNSSHTLTIYMEGCQNMNRVYLSGITGTNNITLKNCTFDGTQSGGAQANSCTVYSNADGAIVVDNCSFSGVKIPVNLNHKANGTQIVTVTDCSFTNCGSAEGDAAKYAAPIRFVNSGSGTQNATVDHVTFTGTIGNNGDILIGDGRANEKSNDVTLTVTNTAANVQAQKPGYYDASGNVTDAALVSKTPVEKSATPVTITNKEEAFYVAKVGEKPYTSLQEAINEAADNATILILKDIELTGPVSAQKTLTFEGVTKSDGTKPVISNSNGGIISQSGEAVYTLKNLELQAAADGQWYVYHSANTLTIENCDFTMADGVSNTGNVVMGEGDPAARALIFRNNTITANSRAALTGVGNGSQITGNIIDLISEKYGNSNSRTSMISLTAKAGGAGVTITGNTFKNANRAIAVDNSTLEASQLTVQNNKFINVRYAFELSPTKNKDSGIYNLNKNYFEFQGVVSEPKVENADSAGSHFGEGENSTEYVPTGASQVQKNEYYTKPTMKDEDLNTYVPPVVDQGGSYEPSGDYLVSVDKATGGKVTVNPGRADKGDTVTITVRPDKGYELDSLTVTAKNGDTVKLTEKSNGKFTFKMPDSKVTVEAVFVKEDSEQPIVTLPFADVNKGDWFYDAVEYVYGNDLMNGTSATAFSPYLTTSRAMMLTMLARYDGVDTTTGSTWYEAGAVWAVAEGISDGTNLEADLTREQLVTMLWRYTGSPVVESDLSAYPDGGAVSDWAVNAMIWATQTGVITGNGAGALAPQGTATRAEVATILARFCAMER